MSDLRGGKIPVEVLKLQQGIYRVYEDFYLEEHGSILKFRMLVLRDHELLGIVDNLTGKFQTQTIDLLQKIKAGDKVYFVEIYTKTLSSKDEIKLNSMEFEVE